MLITPSPQFFLLVLARLIQGIAGIGVRDTSFSLGEFASDKSVALLIARKQIWVFGPGLLSDSTEPENIGKVMGLSVCHSFRLCFKS